MRRKWASGMVAGFGLAALPFLDAEPARAQVSGCQDIQKLLAERQSIVASLNSVQKQKRKLTPAEACTRLNRLVSNGNATVKFAESNMDWCQIPQNFIDGIKADNGKAAGIRNQACNAVKQQAQMQRQAQQQARQRSNNPFAGSDVVTGGPMRVPQGAL